MYYTRSITHSFYFILIFFAITSFRPGGATPLYKAVEKGDIKEVEKLLNNGARVNEWKEGGFTPLHSAALQNKHDIAALLLQHKADINTQGEIGMTPLHMVVDMAVKEEAHEIEVNTRRMITLLLEKNADINLYYMFSGTPLHQAAMYGKVNIAKLLLEKGRANVNAQTTGCEQTPLHIAALHGKVDVVKLLLNDYKAEVNVHDETRQTPLHCATEKGDFEVTKALLEYGADINAQNKQGQTPLYDAVKEKKLNIVKLLLHSKATVSTQDLKCAEGNTEMRSLLQNYPTMLSKQEESDTSFQQPQQGPDTQRIPLSTDNGQDAIKGQEEDDQGTKTVFTAQNMMISTLVGGALLFILYRFTKKKVVSKGPEKESAHRALQISAAKEAPRAST